MISLRAHGDSTGEFNDIGYSARHDVVAALDFLDQRASGQPVVVLGMSLGAAAAVFASGELGHRVQGYILESPYQDLKIAVWNRTQAALPPILDRLAYQGLLTVSSLVLPELEKIAPVSAIAGVPADVPVLILAGGRDRLARPQEAQALLARVKSHGRLLVFKNAMHHNILGTNPREYTEALLEFLRQVKSERQL
jgi:alpha-beta hydrolase superfamily lysophospholipase